MYLCELEMSLLEFPHGEDLVEAGLCPTEVSENEADGRSLVKGRKVVCVAGEDVVVDLESVVALASCQRLLSEGEELRDGGVLGVWRKGGAGEGGEGEGDEEGQGCSHRGKLRALREAWEGKQGW